MTPAEEAEVVRTHQPFIMKHALFAAKTSHRDLDDCFQDASIAFLAACRKWSPEGGANIRTFATPYLRNAAITAWNRDNKKKRKHQAVSMDAERLIDSGDHDDTCTLHDVLGEAATQETELGDAHEASIVRACLQRLPRRQRDVLERRFYEDENLRDIGDSMGISHERVRQIEDAALDKLLRAVVRRGLSR